MIICSHGALSPCFETPRQSEAATSQLTLFARTGGSGAAVTLGELFNASSRVHELLFAGKKRMTSGADTDSNVTPGRAGMIHRAARANHVGLVVFWVNACFHV